MPAGRPNRPLFDLIPDESAEGRRRSGAPVPTAGPAVEIKPAMRPSLQPDHSPSGSGDRLPAPPRIAPRGFWGSLLSTGRAVVEINTPWFAAITALLLAALLGVWILAYKMGESEATRQLAGGVSTAPPKSGSPGSNPAAETPGSTTGTGETTSGHAPDPRSQAGIGASTPVAGSDSSQPPSPGTPSTPTPATSQAGLPPANPNDSGPVLAYNGSYTADPRTPGENYLVLASGMTREDARDSVDFLGRSGFSALAVPYRSVDRSGRDGKNDSLYKVVSAQGYDSGELKETQRQRDKLADEANRLGLIYQRQHRGKYNFAKVNWEKYVR